MSKKAITDFTTTQIAVLLGIGVISGIIYALQPMLLGGVLEQSRITLGQMGHAAMLELGSMGVALGCANAFMRSRRLRTIALLCTLTLIVVNLAALLLKGDAFVASRALSGVAAGLLLWVWIGLLTRSVSPTRLIGIYVVLQGLTLLIISVILPSIPSALGGATFGYAILAILFFGCALVIPLIPNQYEDLGPGGRPGLPGFIGIIGLAACGLFLAAIMALWVYIAPLANHLGLSEKTGNIAISMGLAMQIPAGLLAILLANRLLPTTVLVGGMVLSCGAVAIAATAHTDWLFIVAISIFGFLWIFVPPFQMPYLLQVDVTRRAALQLVTAQIAGGSLGPAVAAYAVESGGLAASPIVAIGMYAAALVALMITLYASRISIAGNVS